MTVVARTIEEVRRCVRLAREGGRTVGLVPTMGALHEGHASLIRAARKGTGFVAVSIFVNPIQFGPQEDFNRYPRPFEADLKVCDQEGVDLVFAPEAGLIYPPGFLTTVSVGRMKDVLCGRSRPGHFDGVTTIVLKLLNIVRPDIAYFGQKDAQQARIIRQMVHDLNLPVDMQVCPIVREPDGLALSSRNRYLDASQRREAVVLYRALCQARERISSGERDAVKIRAMLEEMIQTAASARLDYAEVVDADSLESVARVQGDVLLALAVWFGTTRLIDNLLLHVDGSA